ncbi:FAD/NAD(P)-binding domain-containing protein [Xylariaceae sp. AK1471]|nr:FAD/NAD(P)-binding domain-containing protein [Xylariaceae sp. AK1471]
MSAIKNQSPSTVVDGIHRFSPTGISVIVVGGGVGGLLFALEAWRQGHDIEVFEKSPRLDTLGDAFGIMAPGWATLRFFPTMKSQFERESCDAEFSLWHYEGHELVHLRDGSVNVHIPWIETRAMIAHMLTSQCQRLGIQVNYGSTVIDYDETDDKAVVTIERVGGVTRAEADIIVAADGVGTKSHAHVSGRSVKATSCGYSMFRGLVPMKVIEKDLSPRIIEKFFTSPPPDTHANIILSKEFFAYGLTYKDYNYSEKNAKESWSATVSNDTVVGKFSKLDPDLLEILRLIPDNSAIDWTLRWRDPQPKWTSDGGRVIQLGDSAHSFLPTSGNGATQACEDALSLATCLRIAGKGKESIATKVHSKLRFERVSTIQRFGVMTRSVLHNIDLELAREKPEIIRAKMAMPDYEKAERHILEGTPFQNTNLPPGYTYEPWTIAGEMEKENHANGP